jgi:hypothetical protein
LLALLIIFVVTGAAPMAASAPGTSSPTAEMMASLRQTLDAHLAQRNDWGEIEINHAESRRYALALIYRRQPSIGDPRADSKSIARDVLAVLIKAGRKPAEEMISIQVCSQLPVRGETGKQLFRPYGCAYYDYNHDQLTYEERSGW